MLLRNTIKQINREKKFQRTAAGQIKCAGGPHVGQHGASLSAVLVGPRYGMVY